MNYYICANHFVKQIYLPRKSPEARAHWIRQNDFHPLFYIDSYGNLLIYLHKNNRLSPGSARAVCQRFS